MPIKKKIIVTDVDGVLLNWEDAFQIWMEHQGFKKVKGHQFIYNAADQFKMTSDEGKKWVRLFNQSAAIGFLPPLRDAQEIVSLLHNNYGYRFVICTSLSKDKAAQELRTRNLKKIFGDVFEEFVYLYTGEDKDSALYKLGKKYRGALWIEDKLENAHAGAAVDFEPILMEHGYNMNLEHDYFVAKSWEDIYLKIIKKL
jgi:phosphoglycolate phosphatase-like HAD superfamily hydrolase